MKGSTYWVNGDTLPEKSGSVSNVGSQEQLEVEDGEGNSERGTWGSQVEFVLSCLGYAVGLGNVWRFPYMCYTNGGGAFLIPYAIMLLFVGLPTFFIELTVGQYSGEGPVRVWAAAPLFQGIGIGMVIISFIGSIYYNMIIGWSLYYMFASWQSVLPWIGCNHDYNTAFCYSKREAEECESINGTWFNQTCYNATYFAPYEKIREIFNSTANFTYNETYNSERERFENLTKQQVSPSEEYFNYNMLDRSDTMEDTGELKWYLVLCLLLAWILCYLCILKGIKSSGKVVYFTATFPYVILIILFFRGITLEGASKGIYFYLIPEWEKLLQPKVWADAAGQIFFSLSVGMGGLMTFASYNKFHNNVWRDTLIVTFGNCLTSFFAGFVIFSVLGFMAHELGREVKDVAASGSGLAFIAYPEVVTRLFPSQLWSTLFFFMLLTLGLDSQFAGLENIQTAIVDAVPRLRKYKWAVAGCLCIFMFIIGLPMCARSGIYWEELMSYYSSGWSLVLIGTAEAIVFPWVYGARRLIDDLEMMIGYKPPPWPYWLVLWLGVAPVLLLAILVFNIYEFTPLDYGGYMLPGWAQTLGWLMAVVSVVMIPIVAVIRVIYTYVKPNPRYHGHIGQRIVQLCKPTPDWMPSKHKGNKSAKTKATSDPSTVANGQVNPAYSNSAI